MGYRFRIINREKHIQALKLSLESYCEKTPRKTYSDLLNRCGVSGALFVFSRR